MVLCGVVWWYCMVSLVPLYGASCVIVRCCLCDVQCGVLCWYCKVLLVRWCKRTWWCIVREIPATTQPSDMSTVEEDNYNHNHNHNVEEDNEKHFLRSQWDLQPCSLCEISDMLSFVQNWLRSLWASLFIWQKYKKYKSLGEIEHIPFFFGFQVVILVQSGRLQGEKNWDAGPEISAGAC